MPKSNMSKTSLQLYHVTRHFLNPPGHHTLINSDDQPDESVKAKWDELQTFEDDNPETATTPTTTQRGSTIIVDASMSSLTSSGSGSSSESTSAKNRLGSAKSRWKQMKKGSMKKLSNLTNRLNLNVKGSNAGPHHHHHHGVPNSNQNPGDVVSTAPDGRVHGVLPRIQASKSMQNLEQITRDSYYNFRGATANLKDKCNSFVELRQGQTKSNYDELWDEDSDGNEDVDRRQRVILQRIGLY